VILTDTSALFALLDRASAEHESVKEAYIDLSRADRLATHSYIVLETIALTQRRLGIAAVETLVRRILPSIAVDWVDRPLHDAALDELLASSKRDVSLVDRVSFVWMRRQGVRTAFGLDSDFESEGFELVPGSVGSVS